MSVARRGVSIVELLVIAGLFFGLLSLVALFMVRSKRYAVRTEVLSRVQQEAVKLSRKLSEDVNRGTISGITSMWSSDGVVFLSSKPVDATTEPALEFDPSTGQVVWKQWVAYHRDSDSKEVRRFSKPLPTPVSDSRIATDIWDLSELPGLPKNTGKIVATNIVEFFPTGRDTDNTMEWKIKASGELPLGNLSQAEKIVEVEIFTMIRMGATVGP